MSRDSRPEQPDFEGVDAQRARRLGAWLEGDEHAIEAEDSLFEALFAYRMERDERLTSMPTKEQSTRMWERISDHLKPEPASSPTPIFRLRPWRVAAALAACLLLCGVLFVLLTQTPEATLLARADTAPVTHHADDGSTITLRPQSELYREPVGDEASIRYRIEGEGLFDITSSENRVVEVVADDGLVSVLGTQFSVSTWRERVEVILLEGSVRFEHIPSGHALVMEPGHRALLARDGYFEESELRTPELALGWLENELIFEERPLEDVVLELEHHHSIRILIPEEMKNQTLTGRILLEDPQQSLGDLGIVMGGTFERVDDRTYRFHPN